MDERAGWARPSPLAGRGAELDDLDAVLADVTDGVGATVIIEGEAGVGKSALVGALRDGAGLLGVELRTAQARHADARPFGLVVDAAVAPDVARGPVEDELCGLVDRLAEDPHRSHDRAVELATAVVRRYGGERPWVLVLEDVHEADPGSLEALAQVAREGVMQGGMLVMTMRPVPHRPELAATIAAWTRAGARSVELRPLSPRATLEVAEQLAGGPVGPVLRGAVATTGGNPRLVADVVRTARVHGGLVRRDGVADVEGTAWLEPLDEVVRGRLEYLGPEVLRLLEQASVLGSSFVVADLAALTGEPVEQCWRTLRHGLAAGVVRARGDRLVFGHDLCRGALYHGLDQAERRALHARAAWALDRAGAPSQIVSDHLARAR